MTNQLSTIIQSDPRARTSLLIVAAATIFAASCGFDSRSESFNCRRNSDCESWQRCIGGSCLVAGSSCHPDCDSCENGVCFMNCSGARSCAAEVICPPSSECQVRCSGPNSCGSGIDCSQTNHCVVRCIGENSCAGSIDCGIGECAVGCTGRGSCSAGVDCSSSCSCQTNCRDNRNGRTCIPECPLANQCSSAVGDCTANGAGCDTCASQ